MANTKIAKGSSKGRAKTTEKGANAGAKKAGGEAVKAKASPKKAVPRATGGGGRAKSGGRTSAKKASGRGRGRPVTRSMSKVQTRSSTSPVVAAAAPPARRRAIKTRRPTIDQGTNGLGAASVPREAPIAREVPAKPAAPSRKRKGRTGATKKRGRRVAGSVKARQGRASARAVRQEVPPTPPPSPHEGVPEEEEFLEEEEEEFVEVEEEFPGGVFGFFPDFLRPPVADNDEPVRAESESSDDTDSTDIDSSSDRENWCPVDNTSFLRALRAAESEEDGHYDEESE